MKLLFATANKNKLREAAEILGDMVQVISPSELNINADVEETGETLQDNSILKARTLYDLSGLDCFADGSGSLERCSGSTDSQIRCLLPGRSIAA